jgi:hypothetical protein
MIEEIQLLLPLLEGATEGAFWLVISYMGFQLLQTAIIFVGLYFILRSLFLGLWKIIEA